MKIARFSHSDGIRFGIVDEGDLVVLAGDPMFAGFDTTGERVPLADAALLAPVIPRSKVVCVGRNYREHAAEFGNVAPEEPLLFLKPNTSVIGPGDAILRPAISERTEFEGELVVVIGRIAKNVKAEDALDYVFGYTVGNDFTARDIQRKDGQWTRGKGFDTFCPLGPVIETEFDAASARIETRVNGEVRQQAPLTDMIHSVADIIAYASAAFTLLPGDVIMTGTPAGVGPVVAGDTIEVEVSGIGTLRNPVRDAVPVS
ncbi:MAG: 2-hydroxyhepta-2,4-diene-1,7-dioate isomerase [Microbacterium sp. 69-10]|uniref:fumarylacetoacetate hydrolase family protein n=1 Tax=Microbacterium sp. 69-10 TaxID=1895783 RepID=UPI0009641997|nr:fumarylacetoacetate hydrolase family protein [Microbacterium sp. 69-10]OJU41979.1 MAG: 2-hydroxyhepta-2,4-diene-1,7-dioate isomerase [Microbacterium sp. 69-10]